MLTPIVKRKKDIKDNYICQRTTHSPHLISPVMLSLCRHRVPDLLEALKQLMTGPITSLTSSSAASHETYTG